MAADGGYASIENLREAQKLQVKDVAFHKNQLGSDSNAAIEVYKCLMFLRIQDVNFFSEIVPSATPSIVSTLSTGDETSS